MTTEPTAWLPTVMILGAPKAGTSALHRWIADHPDALGSVEKEACFFVDPHSHTYRAGANIIDGLQAYRAQFVLPDGPPPRAIIESSPAYMYQEAALRHIPDLPSRPHCLFLVREPADQILSLYSYFRNNWSYIPAEMTFTAFLDAVDRGSAGFGGNELAQNAIVNAAYVDHLLAWRARLGADRIHVFTYDRLRADPKGLVKAVAEIAGLDPGFYDGYGFPRENESYVPRSRALQKVNIALRAKLPKGAAYRAARALYRRLNTTKGKEDSAADLGPLRERFRASNRRLAEEFALDLSGWPL